MHVGTFMCVCIRSVVLGLCTCFDRGSSKIPVDVTTNLKRTVSRDIVMIWGKLNLIKLNPKLTVLYHSLICLF